MPKRKATTTPTKNHDWDSRWARAQQERITLDLDDQFFSQDEVRIGVFGTKLNPYSVVIKRDGLSSCTCHDHQINGFFCKHLMLVLIRTFHVPEDLVEQCQENTHAVYLDCAFLYKERKEKDVVIWKEGIEALEALIRKPIDEQDDCAICCENLLATMKKEKAIWCSTCGKTVHDKCFGFWKKQGKKTCVYCRAETEFNVHQSVTPVK